MQKKEYNIRLIFVGITVFFFYQIFLHGRVPFPGDLLIGEYVPWKYSSFLGYGAGGFPSKGQYFDVLRQMYPWKTLVITLIKQWQFPLWNPYNFSGAPLFANFQSAVLYPFTFFSLVFSQSTAWTIQIILQPLLMSLFTYLFVRKIGFARWGAVLSSLSFAFSSYTLVWLEYNTIDQVILWLPLSLLAVEKLLEKRSALWSFIFVISLVVAFFAGHPQVYLYSLFFTFSYLIYRIGTKEDKTCAKAIYLFFFIGLSLLATGIQAIQLLPGLELIQNAARSPHDYHTLMSKILIQPWQLSMIFIQDIFGNPATRNYWISDTYIGKAISIGLVPTFFALFALFKWKDVLVRFFISTAVVVLVLITANPITSILYTYPLPFLSSSAPTLATFLWCFALSILAGYGLDSFIAQKKKTVEAIAIMAFMFGCVWGGVFIAKMVHIFPTSIDFSTTSKNALLLTLIFLVTSALALLCTRTKKIQIVLACLFVLFIAQQWYQFEKFNPFVPASTIFPPVKIISTIQKESSISRFWGVGAAHIEANIATQFGIFSPEGYDPLYPKWYGEFIQSSLNGHIPVSFTDQTRSDAIIAPADGKSFAKDSYRLRLLNLLGVRFILDRAENGSSEETFPSATFHTAAQFGGWTIFENKDALPRAFTVGRYATYNSAQDFTHQFFNTTFNPFQTILLPKSIIGSFAKDASDKVNITSYQSNQVMLLTQTKYNSLLFLSDTYYPGWSAYIDGKETPIYKADYAFRAITLPAGVHDIRFTFESDSFRMGSIVSLISCILLFVSLVLIKKTYEA